nr:integrase, catalytic region, zinc finger, CCHC-type, peptidase aspartic, catalytic [Tanacetum cinerariifolium]
MSTQQDIYAAGSESRPPMLNKENYVSWSSRLLRYAKSRPNGKLIHNSILNGPYVRKMIPEPGDANREITVTETFHLQTNDELSDKELKKIEANDQAIQTILLGLPEDIYAAVDSCETAQEIWLRVQQMMKGSDIRIQEKKAKLFNEWERFTSNEGESIESYYHRFVKLMNNLKRNKHFPEKIASNLKFLNNLQPEWSRHLTIVHQTKDLHTADYTQLYDFLKYNQKEVDELNAERLTKTQDPLALMANSNNPYAFSAPHQDQPSFNQNYLQQPMPNPKDITDPTTAMNMALALMDKAFKLNYSTPTNNNQRISSNPRNKKSGWNQIGNGNLVAVRAEGSAAGQNGNQIRNCTVRPRRRDAAYLQTQLLITQKEEAGIQLQAKELAEVHNYENCYDNEIFNMFTQEEQYTELLELIPEPQQVPQNNNVISKDTNVEQVIEVEKVNSVNRKLKVTNADLITELARYKNQERMANVLKSFSIPNEDLSDDITPSVSRKFLNEVKSTIVTLQRVVKQQMTIETHNWASSAHQELYKIVREEIFPIVNQVDARVQNFEIQFLKEAAKFVGDFKSLANEADASLAKHKTVELEIERLLKAVVSQDIMIIVQNEYVVDTSVLQTELEYNTQDTSKNTKIAKQPIVENLPKIGETNALSKPVTSNSVSTPQESKGVNNDKVIATGLFRINSFKTSREEKHVPNTVSASARTKPITVSQPPVITKKYVNSDLNGLSSTGVDNTKTRRPQPRSNTKHDRVRSASKSSRSKNKEAEVEEHHRNLLLSKNNKHISSACNNIQIDSQDVISKAVCATCMKCLIFVNHDKCLRNYVNGKNSHGQFCDSDLEVAFRRDACFVRNLKGVDLLKGDRSTNLYTINLNEMASASPICLMARASSTKSCLWHQRLFHLNFDTINDLARNDLVAGLPKFKYHKEHLCPSCEQGKSKRASHPPKPVPNSRQRLHLLHMDLCGPMRIVSINGKRYVLVIMDNYSRYMWVYFLRSKDEAPEVIIKFLKRITVLLQSPVIIIRTDNGTEFKNQMLKEYFDTVGISHQMSYVRTPQQNGSLQPSDKKIMETMNVSFDELSAMAFEQRCSKPGLQRELDLLFEAMYDDYIGGQPSATARTVPPVQEPQVCQTSTASTRIADIAPTLTNSSSHATIIPITSQDVDKLNSNAMVDGIMFVNPFANSSTSTVASSSSQNVDPSNMHTFYQPYPHEFQWTKDFMGTVRFENDHVAAILGFGDLQWGNILITRVYFVEGLGHNLFSVGQFCDSDLEVAFRRNACFVRNLEGVDVLKEITSSSYGFVWTNENASINGKRYVLVIVDDYSRYTWVHFLRYKDEAPEVIIKFLKRITVLLHSPVIIIRTDNGTEFKNQVLKEYFDTVGISHQMSSVRTPQQNGVVK